MGQLTLRGKSNAVEFFTQNDIEKKQLMYRHTGDIKSVKDTFRFEVSVENVFVEDDFHIRMFPAVYWEPLVLVHNKTLFVDEASDVIITRDDLLVRNMVRGSFFVFLFFTKKFYSYGTFSKKLSKTFTRLVYLKRESLSLYLRWRNRVSYQDT